MPDWPLERFVSFSPQADDETDVNVQIVESQPKSLMWHRISAVRRLTGGRRTLESQLSASDRSSIWVGHFESELKKCFIL